MNRTAYGVIFFLLVMQVTYVNAQNVYTIKADSVKLTNCDSTELILENHTQGVKGFLYNTGNGRTVFKKGVQKLNDSAYLIGADTLKYNAWVQGGNAFGATGVLGTTDNHHLDLYTRDTARARLTSTGNLLLGTTTDNSAKLRVHGIADLDAIPFANNNRAHLMLTTNGGLDALLGFYGHNMIFQTIDSNTQFMFQFGGSSDLVSTGVDLAFAAHGSGNISMASANHFIDLDGIQHIQIDASSMNLTSGGYNGMDGVVIQRNARSTLMTDPLFTIKESDTVVMRTLKNGKVGIGTASPTTQFHTTGGVRFAGLTNDSSQTRVLVSDADGNLYYRNASSLAANDIMHSSLAVNGTITAKKLQLSAGSWPDYVFDSAYRMMPLQELEQYIRQNNHLPGILPAAEAKKDGVDVGETQTAVLKKIEELTLYIIRQNKDISDLKQQLKELKKRRKH